MKRTIYFMLLLFTLSVNFAQMLPIMPRPDTYMTTPTGSAVWENPDYESVRRWLCPDEAYSDTVDENNVGSCELPWDNVVSRDYWVKDGAKCRSLISGEWNLYFTDSIIIPIPPEWTFPESLCCQCTTATCCTTIYIDTTRTYTVYQSNGIYFLRYNSYICDSLLMSVAIDSIDTISVPHDTLWDSLYCVFCDSVMNITWGQYECVDTICSSATLDFWRITYPSQDDYCDLIPSGTYHYEGDIYEGNYIDMRSYSYDTINYVTNWDIQQNEYITEQNFYSYELPDGIWVKDCDCEESHTLTTDSTAFLFCISESWYARALKNGKVCIDSTFALYDRGALNDTMWKVTAGNPHAWETAKYSIMGADAMGSLPSGLTPFQFLQYAGYAAQGCLDMDADAYPNPRRAYILADSLYAGKPVYTLNGDSTITPKATFYQEYDTTLVDDPLGHTTFCTFIADRQEERDTYGEWADMDRFRNRHGDVDPPTRPHHAYKFFTYLKLSDYLSDETIYQLNISKPTWSMLTLPSYVIPYVKFGKLNDTTITIMDTITQVGTTARYRFRPMNIDYSEPIYIETGVWSQSGRTIGMQALFAIDFVDTIRSSCYSFEDSITLPGCVSAINATRTIVDSVYTINETTEFNELVLLCAITASYPCRIVLNTSMLSYETKIIIKDSGFNASVKNITITCESGTTKIDGSTGDYVINSDGGSVTLVNNGTDWFTY